jgi:hypothetical protein
VKALELQQLLSAMGILAGDISQLSDPYELFRLDADTQLPPPKWVSANDWSPIDDSMLLLGCFLHGVGNWERLADDKSLGLASKLAGAVKDGPKVGDKAFPQGACRALSSRAGS